ncbi:hypothetical protein VPNG_03302 [Cytospora leucostoma]|uniref:G domain-containing protein n=1 Tax=Cytospora leucostoma TaxID=1230097 RepID=A0A423XFD6_9PEZI|nr:hypothetical protein VPNG_03302 [Cytospora leucostoma]
MARTTENVPTVEGSAARTTTSASRDGSTNVHGQMPDNGRRDENTRKTPEQASGRTSEAIGADSAPESVQRKVKVEKQLGQSGVSQDNTSASAIALTEDATGPSVKTEVINGTQSAIDTPQEPKKITLDQLRKVSDSTDLVKLEAGVETARGILDAIRLPMADSKQREQLEWLKAIDQLKTKSKRTRTVIAVCGSTGAGKSSLINAVLDEAKLMPVNGYRACSATITEISYNESEIPEEKYRAEVEFISPEDWVSELQLLWGDLVDDNQLSSAYLDANAEAGIAYAKIKAVYPDLTREMIVKSKPEELANRKSVTAVVGKARKFAYSNAGDLYLALQKYLDSKEKGTKGSTTKPQDMAFWPLIKVVRVYCKADCLSSGAVLVDLPGIHDANAARSAVASRYMAECSAIFVAAPIRRAADDKAAHDLMGRGSRLQLKLDGIYSNVTFICTMTDAIELSESIEAFDEDGQIQAILSRGDELDKAVREKKDTLKQLEQQADEIEFALEAVEKELSIWEGLEKKKNKGQQVYPPRIPAKRKRPMRLAKGRRRRQVVEYDSDSDAEAIDAQTPLTIEEILSKLTELNAQVQAREGEYTEMKKRCEDLDTAITALQTEKEGIAGESIRCCIQKRNERVRQAIRVDFAAGIREIDEEDAQADEETFDPSIKKRDYDEVAASLPVFCTSSVGYQQLSGRRSNRENRVQGFRYLLDTEIPLVQDHLKKLPENRQILALKAFLNDFYRLLNSLTIWVTSSALELKATEMSEQDQGYEIKYLRAAAQNLKNNLSMLVLNQKQEICNIQHSLFNSKSTGAITHASKAIEGIVEKWSLKKADGGHGLTFSTYKAVCRRGGSKTKSDKSRNFNEDILEPYLLKIATGWEQAFCVAIPASLDKLVDTLMDTLKGFHNEMSSRPELEKCKLASLNILGHQIKSHETSIRDMVGTIKASIQAEQRQANRAFLPEIKKEMTKAYSQCKEEKGRGCFLRMKEHMMKHVSKNKSSIYRKASQHVMKDLEKLFETNRKEMEETVHYIVDVLEGDFRTIISSSEMIEASAVARDHIRGVLCEVDSQFEKVLCMEQTATDPAHTSQDVSEDISAVAVASDAPQIDTSESMGVDP